MTILLKWMRAVPALMAACLVAPLFSDAEAPLVVGMELAYPPFEMSDERGQPAGVSVDLAHALGEHLGREVRIENTPFVGLIPSLRTGRIDLIISSMTATEERARAIDFSEPYLRTGLALLVGADSDIESIEDLAQRGRRVAVKQGTTGHLYARRHLPEARLLLLERESVAVLEVVAGRVDAFIYDQMSIFRHWQRNPERTRPILEAFQEEVWAIGVRQDRDDGLLEEINSFLQTFGEAGGFEALGRSYLSEEKAAFAERGIPFVF